MGMGRLGGSNPGEIMKNSFEKDFSKSIKGGKSLVSRGGGMTRLALRFNTAGNVSQTGVLYFS